MEIIFWFGGILGALLVAVGLFMLIQRARAGGWVFLAGLVLGALLIPALGLFKDTQAYLITGLVGVGLFLLGIFVAPRVRRVGPALIGLGVVLATFMLPAFKLAQPWNTNPVALISGTPTAPVAGIQPTEPAPLTPTNPNTPAPATDPNAQAPAASTPSVPEQPTLPTEPFSQPSAAQQPQTDQPQAMQPSPPPAQPDATQPAPTTPSAPANQPVGAVESNQLCPCVLRVSSGISDATVVLSKDGRELSRQVGAQVVFSGLEMGAYSLSVEALGHQTFTTPLQVSNNKDLTVYLLRQQ